MNFMSKAEDVEFLAHELVKVLGDKISINREKTLDCKATL